MTTPNQVPFAQDLALRLADLKTRAEAVGQTITSVCRNTGVARATYERWLQRPPQTIQILDQMREEVERMEGEFEKVLRGAAGE